MLNPFRKRMTARRREINQLWTLLWDLQGRVDRLEHPSEVLRLKPSRKARTYTAPRCKGAGSAGGECPRHTLDPSGYCKTHREGVSGVNGNLHPMVHP